MLASLLMVFLCLGTVHTAELNHLSIRYEEAIGTNRSFEYQEKKKGELGLNFNYQILKFIDLDTTVNSKIDERQFRYVELEPIINIHLNKHFIFYVKHRSGHCLDCVYTNINRFPNENGVGIKWILYQK